MTRSIVAFADAAPDTWRPAVIPEQQMGECETGQVSADAEELPLDDGGCDAAVSQFGLMYFADQEGALREMMRVLRPGGNLAVVVWDKLENSPEYAVEDQLFQRLLGEEAAYDVPYSLGDKQVLQCLFTDAGIPDAQIQTCTGTARFPSIEAWIYADVRGWTSDDSINDEQYEVLLSAAQIELAQFVTADGTIAFAASAHIVTASKPQTE